MACTERGDVMIFSCENKDEATLAFMKRTSEAVRQPITNVTMPLFNVEGGYICATGVLLKVRDKHFILTAAHVFDKWQTSPIPLNITDRVNGNLVFPIGEVTLRRSPTASPRNRLAGDPFDIGVCDITQT